MLAREGAAPVSGGSVRRMELSKADLVWNRAATDHGGSKPREGDRALSALLLAHGLVMNGGVEHAIECLSEAELEAACEGFVFFGFGTVAALLRSVEVPEFDDLAEDVDDKGGELDSEYSRLVPADSTLVARFEKYYHERPFAFAPSE